MYQPQYAWNLSFFQEHLDPGLIGEDCLTCLQSLRSATRQLLLKIKQLCPIFKKMKSYENLRKRNKETWKKKRHFLMLKLLKLDCEMWPCLTFCWNMIGLAVKRWLIMFYQFFRGHVRRAVLLCYSNYAANCMPRKWPCRQCLKYWLLRFKGKRTLLNCCWFKLIHVWFCDAVKVRLG